MAAIRFINRNSQECSEAEWCILSRDPGYVVVDRVRSVSYEIEASWLGVVSEHENGGGKPFLLRAFNLPSMTTTSNYREGWFASERELRLALDRWKKICLRHGRVPADAVKVWESA